MLKQDAMKSILPRNPQIREAVDAVILILSEIKLWFSFQYNLMQHRLRFDKTPIIKR